jgi:hypothetical protein
MKMSEDFAPDIDNKKNWLLHHNYTLSHTSFITGEVFTKNNMTTNLHQPYSPDLGPCNFPVFPHLKIKLKDHHFATTEAIKAESHEVLNTHREHNFLDALRKWQKR